MADQLTVYLHWVWTSKLCTIKVCTVNGDDIWTIFDGDNWKADCFYNQAHTKMNSRQHASYPQQGCTCVLLHTMEQTGVWNFMFTAYNTALGNELKS